MSLLNSLPANLCLFLLMKVDILKWEPMDTYLTSFRLKCF